jgi:hypothetical protein
LEEDKRGEGTYSDADAAADLVAYLALRRAVSIRSLAGVAVVALLVVHWLLFPALALVTGGLCGVLNAQLTGSSGELLLKNRTVGLFVLSSFLRIGVFGIVPVAFAVHGPWWSMAWYFAGFFLPLALFAVGALRAFERK